MSELPPPTENMPAGEVPARWGELLDRVQQGAARVVVAQDGRSVAALISYRDLERLLNYEAERKRDFAIMRRIGEAFSDVPDDVQEREIEKAVAEARAELRAEREAEKTYQAQHSA